jgi:hypothetical protein
MIAVLDAKYKYAFCPSATATGLGEREVQLANRGHS